MPRVLTGQKEIKEMLVSVMVALGEIGLIEEIRMFRDRVLVLDLAHHGRVLDYDQIGENWFRVKFTPMVELALVEIKATAEAPGWTDEMRKKRISEILDLAGF